ncbi:MAG: DNA methyltransferase, partial [Candidatus Eisenbacteria bacterium]|nr:DNA methyltransferase [Candidatus Eisenbacteria bacterium]
MPESVDGAYAPAPSLADELAVFDEFGTPTTVGVTEVNGPSGRVSVDTFTNEFWTSKQRAANRLHEVSYRACFKPQLPRFFIDRLTSAGDVVYDPFMGRGTTLLEAALAGRAPAGCDINPLSEIIVRPRLEPPELREVEARLG